MAVSDPALEHVLPIERDASLRDSPTVRINLAEIKEFKMG